MQPTVRMVRRRREPSPCDGEASLYALWPTEYSTEYSVVLYYVVRVEKGGGYGEPPVPLRRRTGTVLSTVCRGRALYRFQLSAVLLTDVTTVQYGRQRLAAAPEALVGASAAQKMLGELEQLASALKRAP